MTALHLAPVPLAQAAIQISGDPAAGGQGVQNFQITPDSATVVYRGEMNTAGISELFSASTTQTGTQIQLSSTPVAGGNVSGGLFLTPDGNAVVYQGDLNIDNTFELFSAATTDAGTQVQLSDTPSDTATQDVNQTKLTPDGTLALYRADLHTDNDFELYSAMVGATGTQVRLTNPPVAGGDVGVNDFFPTADGTRVVYIGDLDTDGVDELYSASTTAAGTQIKLNDVSAIGGDIDDDFLLTSDGSRVVYRGALDTLFRNELFSAPTDQAGMQLKLSGPPVAGFSGVDSFFQVTPDGSRVMYTGVLESAGVRELFSAPTDAAGMQIKLNNTPVAGGNLFARIMTPDGTRAVYTGDLLVDEQRDLFSAPIDVAGQQIQLNSNPAGGSVSLFRLTEDGSRVVYAGDMNTQGQGELYSAPTDSAGGQLTLSTNALGDDGGIGNFEVSPDGTRVAYAGLFTTMDVFDLYVASAMAEATQVNVTNFSSDQQNVFNFDFSPDGKFVVFDVDTDGNFRPDALFAVDSKGQSPAFQLNDPQLAAGQITTFSITPDSQTVLYTATPDQTMFGDRKLFAASLVASPMGLPGDFNGDNVVDAADYTVWRDNLGGAFNLAGNGDETGASAGVVDAADYDLWVAQFGESLPAALQTAAVPEPSAVTFLVAGGALLICRISLRTLQVVDRRAAT